MSRTARATAGTGMFDRGYYQMGSMPSRHLMERDQKSHSILRLRPRQSGLSTEEELKRLKRDLEERETGTKPAAGQLADAASQSKPLVAGAFDDADEEPDESSSSSEEDEREANGAARRSSDDEDSSEEEDDEAEELRRELAKIKQEREQVERVSAADLSGSNPLLDSSVRRRWDDDVVFRNQAKDEPHVQRRFINDTIRSDFHKAFLKKYVR
jgi:protein CWC15